MHLRIRHINAQKDGGVMLDEDERFIGGGGGGEGGGGICISAGDDGENCKGVSVHATRIFVRVAYENILIYQIPI